ncbi:MAG: proline dehydrogenase family protein [Flavobacteriales bacterium]
MRYFNNTEIAFAAQSDQSLRSARLLFRWIGDPILTKVGTALLNGALRLHLPVARVIEKTAFKHFVAGGDLADALHVVRKLARYNIRSIMDYAVEGKSDESDFERTFQATLSVIDFASTHREIPFVVFKPSGFGRLALYQKMSAGGIMSTAESEEWKRVVARFDRVCRKARENDLTAMVDAEESWVQKAVDDLVFEMMKKYNRHYCAVCNTLQMYRKDRLAYLKARCEIAEKADFFIGYKVVRGAYMEKETARAAALGYENPIHLSKGATDRDYDAAVDFILDHLDRISLFAGTHNEKSCYLLKQNMKARGIAKDHQKIWFGQLYGMGDHISFELAHAGYNVAKYLPYGPLRDVMPYLIRRARENTSVKGQASREVSLIQSELKRRKSIRDNSHVPGN